MQLIMCGGVSTKSSTVAFGACCAIERRVMPMASSCRRPQLTNAMISGDASFLASVFLVTRGPCDAKCGA